MSASFSGSTRLMGRGTPELSAETLLSAIEIGALGDFASGPVDCRHSPSPHRGGRQRGSVGMVPGELSNSNTRLSDWGSGEAKLSPCYTDRVGGTNPTTMLGLCRAP